MRIGAMGRAYKGGDCIVRQGQSGDSMYVVQRGQVEVVLSRPDGEIVLDVLEPGDVFGEMALFTKEPRSATVRSRGAARVLTVDKPTFLRRVHEDPSLAFRILQRMSQRLRAMDDKIERLTNELERLGEHHAPEAGYTVK